ncbi:p450 domain-containing protein [Cephalotus follicularis]|uniref:p450 domain-containing protein n=1 Tax=Cephalotus follicularis TaxID=3775 RepID=A0A1Q3BKL2_CEPFO|nr:p450 domain-containing protein [Cephalotus follicularis]
MATIGYLEMLVVLCFLLLCHRSWNKISLTTNWPIVGMLPGLLYALAVDIHDYGSQILKQCGGTFEFKGPWFANLNFLVTSDPMNVRHILTQNFANYPKGPEFKKLFEPFGDGFLNSDSDSWKFHRNMVQSHIRGSKFQLYLEKCIQGKVSKGLIPVLEQVSRLRTDVDLQDVFQRFTFDNTCLLVLGFDPKSLTVGLPEVPHEKAFDDVQEAVFNRHVWPESIWRLQKWLQIGKEKKLSRALQLIDQFLYQCIASKKEQFCRSKNQSDLQIEDKEEYSDILTANIEGESKINDGYLRDMAFNFIAAGRDTVSASLTWLLWLVSTHPDVKEKILEEIKVKLQVKEEDGKLRFFNVEELSKLVYLHGAVCESLRLYPSVPFNLRVSLQPDILPSGHRVNGNTRVFVSPYLMRNNEDTWGEDCLKFKPERWISEDGGIIHVPSYKFSAFHSGPRSCLGRNITFIQMKMIATAVLWNYDVQLVEGHPVSPSLSVLLHMEHGLKVRVTKTYV